MVPGSGVGLGAGSGIIPGPAGGKPGTRMPGPGTKAGGTREATPVAARVASVDGEDELGDAPSAPPALDSPAAGPVVTPEGNSPADILPSDVMKSLSRFIELARP